jgi:hypothetical protein
MVGDSAHESFMARAKESTEDAAEHVDGYEPLKYEALALRFRPKPISDYLRTDGDTNGSAPADYDALEPG